MSVFSVGSTCTVSSEFVKKATLAFAEDRLLGRGGFGSVYLGSVPNEKPFAVKRLDDVTSAERELSVLSRFQHPHIVRLLGFTPEGAPTRCLIYELLERGSLEKILR